MKAIPWVPKPWQIEGGKFVVSKSAGGLFYDMGLGKTATMLAAIDILKRKGLLPGAVLIIAPIRTLYTVWPAEAQKWKEFAHFRFVNLHEEGEDAVSKDADIYLINPERAQRLFNSPLKRRFSMLIIDESSLWKNPQSKRFLALRKVLHLFERRWILTGTPIPNGLADCWSQLFIIDGGQALGRYITHFRNAFCVPDWSGYGWNVTEAGAREIEKRMAPLVLRRSVGDGGAGMPPKLVNKIIVELPPTARKIYDDMWKTLIATVGEDEVWSPNAATASGRCRQIAGGAIYANDSVLDIHSEKIDAVIETIHALNRPVLVFYEFAHEAERIIKRYPDARNLSGAVPEEAKLWIKQFREGQLKVLIAHPISGGFGLNLQQSCSDVLFTTPPWDLSAYEQGIGRVWRMGQERPVTVHHVIANDTLDEEVMEALEGKRSVQQSLLDTVRKLRVASHEDVEHDAI